MITIRSVVLTGVLLEGRIDVTEDSLDDQRAERRLPRR